MSLNTNLYLPSKKQHKILTRKKYHNCVEIQIKTKRGGRNLTVIKPNTSISQDENIPFIFGMHVCPMVQQILHHWHAVISCSKVQWCWMAAFQISTIHILRAAKLLWKEIKSIRRLEKNKPTPSKKIHKANKNPTPHQSSQCKIWLIYYYIPIFWS